MNIRKKILVYFFTVAVSLVAVTFVVIYVIFSDFRQEEFRKRLGDEISTTIKYLIDIENINHDVILAMDKYTLNNLYTEKVLIFDANKKIIYTGIEDMEIEFSSSILRQLSETMPLIEKEEGDFEVVGAYIHLNNKSYYGIAKAYDKFGMTKLDFLKTVLIVAFFIFSITIFLIIFYLSKQISRPINQMAFEINKIDLNSGKSGISIPDSRDEIHLLAQRFNDMMARLNSAFAFQKHAIHHISHELKTPIAILVSNFEKMESERDIQALKDQIRIQKEDTKNLSAIINALLEISKTESGNVALTGRIRIDDLLYDTIAELQSITPTFKFDIDIIGEIRSEEDLTISGNERLIKSVLVNLVENCIKYSDDHQAKISISSVVDVLTIEFINHGKTIRQDELPFMFQHFFRGENSKGKRGFGLGLVLISQILNIHNGQITYSTPNDRLNVFTISFQLR